MYSINVNGQYLFEIETENEFLKVNHEVVQVDSVRLSKEHFHFIHESKSYNVELVSENKTGKSAVVKVNGNIYEIAFEDQFDQLLKKMGMGDLATAKLLEIKAPMPGMVLTILVEEGQKIQKGDNLLVLEAMKMENMIKSVTHGIVKKILINQGEKVEKNQILIQFDS